MTENIYRFGLVIDVENVGKVKIPKMEGKGKEERVIGWETVVDIGEGERITRISALLDAIYNLAGFAKQARAATSLAPDIIIVFVQDTYNQRGLKSLELNEKVVLNWICWNMQWPNIRIWAIKFYLDLLLV